LRKSRNANGRKPQRARKQSPKQREIVQLLRDDIIKGRYKPGTQIPIQTELVSRFGMSSVTVQRALHELRETGFLVAKRRVGTFVAPKPPHLDNYGLVFPSDPKHTVVWGNFYEALRIQAQTITQGGEKTVQCFFGAEEYERNEDYIRLVGLIRNRQISGLIFASPAYRYAGTPLVDDTDLPRVMISTPNPKSFIPVVAGDTEMHLQMSVKYLTSIGHCRIAHFSTNGAFLDQWLRRQSEFAPMGVVTKPQWCFAVAATEPQTATACARLLMDLPAETRPNAIIVRDDHLTEAVENGLIAADDPTARETSIVAACNFPDRFAHQLPIKRLGVDALEFIKSGIRLIDLQQSGKKVPQIIYVQPHFAEDR